jgi:hypothetical protein
MNIPAFVISGGQYTIVIPSKDSISIQCDSVVYPITERDGQDTKNTEHLPRVTQFIHNPEKGCALFVESITFNVQHGLIVVRRIIEVIEYCFPLSRLNTAQFERSVGVFIDDKVSPGVAELAYSVKKNDAIAVLDVWWIMRLPHGVSLLLRL